MCVSAGECRVERFCRVEVSCGPRLYTLFLETGENFGRSRSPRTHKDTYKFVFIFISILVAWFVLRNPPLWASCGWCCLVELSVVFNTVHFVIGILRGNVKSHWNPAPADIQRERSEHFSRLHSQYDSFTAFQLSTFNSWSRTTLDKITIQLRYKRQN